jgi:ribonuclease HI
LLPYIEKHSINFYRVKGHVNINSKAVNLDKLYENFVKWNGLSFSYDDFIYVTEKNNRVDKLANMGIDDNR